MFCRCFVDAAALLLCSSGTCATVTCVLINEPQHAGNVGSIIRQASVLQGVIVMMSVDVTNACRVLSAMYADNL